MVDDRYVAVAWRSGRNFTRRWHLEERDQPGRTLCLRWIPEGVPVSRHDALVHDCEGCEQVRQHEVLKRLEAAR